MNALHLPHVEHELTSSPALHIASSSLQRFCGAWCARVGASAVRSTCSEGAP